MVTARQKRQRKREKDLDVALAKGERKAGTKERVTEKEAFKPKTKAAPIIDLSGDRKAKKAEKKAKLTKTLTKTAGVLGGTLAVLTGVGAATGAFAGAGAAAGTAAGVGGRAVITRTATQVFGRKLTATTQRAFVGKPAISKVGKLFQGKNAGLGRFASNTKSTGLTTSLIKKIGGASAIVGIIGSYPFAGFIKEEALQTLGFAARTAADNGDIEGLQNAIQEQEEILDPTVWDKIINTVPYLNVISQLKTFFNAARVKLDNDKQTLANLAGDVPTPFEESRQEARQTKLEERARDAEYFNLIREGKFDEAQTLLDTELAGG